MSKDQGFLKDAYHTGNAEETRALYDRWAETYDAEIRENGYATPSRCAAALAGFVPDQTAPVLDVGCGTGLSGLALRDAGFALIDGCDLSAEMLKQAAERDRLYRALIKIDLNDALPFEPGAYTAIAAIGVLASGNAPAGLIDQMLEFLPADGFFVFSLNDNTLKDPEYEARIVENIDTGQVRLLFRQHGPHLPGIGMQSTVYVMQKT